MATKADPADTDLSAHSSYNQVFEFFVERPDQGVDLAGLIAYSLYKSQKREWLIAYRERFGQPPSIPELMALTGGYINADARLIYRGQAESLLNAYAETYVDARTPSLREDALNNETLRQAKAIEHALTARTSFWPSVWSGIVATALWTFVIAILAAALRPDIFRTLFSAVSEAG